MGGGVSVGGGVGVWSGGGEVLVGGGGEGLEGGDVAVASGTAVAVGSLMGASGVAVASDSVARTSGAVGGLVGDDAFTAGPGSDFGPCGPLGAVDAAVCSDNVLKVSDHQPPSRVPGPDRTWTTPFLSTPTLDDWVVML